MRIINLIIAILIASFFVALKLNSATKKYILWYDKQAPNNGAKYTPNKDDNPYDSDWENWSLPVGNGYLGANIFGRTDTERIQLSENSMYVKGLYGGVGSTSFAELFLDFNHNDVTDYRRELSLNDAISTVSYTSKGVKYTREVFASYPDKVLVIRLNSDKKGKLSFKVRPVIPYKKEFGSASKGNGRKGIVYADSKSNTIVLSGELEYLNIKYEGQFKIQLNGGKVKAINDLNNDNGILEVSKATSATILVAIGTNYLQKSSVIKESVLRKKLENFPHPHDRICSIISDASAKSFETLKNRHLIDYKTYFDRVNLDLGGVISKLPTDILLSEYKKNKIDVYLEELYFQYGRYLLISSSRPGCLPANLQGVWNQWDLAPWNGRYYHNVNVQMNYWPTFNTNLAEMFIAYADYYKTYLPAAENDANNYIKLKAPQNFSTLTGENGWTVASSTSPYSHGTPGSHSGPGMNGLTSKMFWDYYDFTRDKSILRDFTYPSMLGSSKFLSKLLKDTLGLKLIWPSASPEQQLQETKKYYWTTGCAFDQQMTYENHKGVIECAQLLGINNDQFINKIKSELPLLDPVLVGMSGQIKEYREENYYSEIGDPKHRHISHLMGLSPGNMINDNTPVWMDAAKITMNLRGDKSTGWAMGHRLNIWARLKDGNRAHDLYKMLLQTGTLNNLWDTHPPFQIDGNFGGTAGVAEMLLQSHDGYIAPLAALPVAWRKGEFQGLVARGNFVFSVKWDNGFINNLSIHSRAGAICRLKYYNIHNSNIKDNKGNVIGYRVISPDMIEFNTKVNAIYTFNNIDYYKRISSPAGFIARRINENNLVEFKWDRVEGAESYKIYRSVDNNPNYVIVKDKILTNLFSYNLPTTDTVKGVLFKIVAVDATGRESVGTVINSQPLKN